jgi:hypothetical protein
VHRFACPCARDVDALAVGELADWRDARQAIPNLNQAAGRPRGAEFREHVLQVFAVLVLHAD